MEYNLIGVHITIADVSKIADVGNAYIRQSVCIVAAMAQQKPLHMRQCHHLCLHLDNQMVSCLAECDGCNTKGTIRESSIMDSVKS